MLEGLFAANRIVKAVPGALIYIGPAASCVTAYKIKGFNQEFGTCTRNSKQVADASPATSKQRLPPLIPQG